MTNIRRHDEFDVAENRRATVVERLILAWLSEDDSAIDVVAEQVDDSVDCWRAIAVRSAFMAALYMCGARGHDNAIAETERQIAQLLGAAERHHVH